MSRVEPNRAAQAISTPGGATVSVSRNSSAVTKMDFEEIYSEILAQYTKAGTVEEKIWITYLEEGIGKLEEDYRMQVPIADRVSELANEYRERLYLKLKPR